MRCEGCGAWTERPRWTADDVRLCKRCYDAVPVTISLVSAPTGLKPFVLVLERNP